MLFSRNTEKINPIGLVHGITELNLELKHSLFDKKMLTCIAAKNIRSDYDLQISWLQS